jgi:hypothetical protein
MNSAANPSESQPLSEPRASEPEDLAREGLGAAPNDAPSLYLDLLKRAIANIIYQDQALFYCEHGRPLKRGPGFDLRLRVVGEDMPSQAHSMVGVRRLENIQHCIENVLRDNVPGDLIETGVASGGSAIFMRGALKAYGCVDRIVYAADAFVTPLAPLRPWQLFLAKWVARGIAAIPFEGWRRRLCNGLSRAGGSFPPIENPSEDVRVAMLWFIRNFDLTYALGRRTGLTNVRANFARYGLLDDQIRFLRGYFSDTLPAAPFEKIAVMRLDGDLYESTMDSLTYVYPKLSAGGYCIIDDYHAFPSCARAVDEYREQFAISSPLEAIDRVSVFWRKEK